MSWLIRALARAASGAGGRYGQGRARGHGRRGRGWAVAIAAAAAGSAGMLAAQPTSDFTTRFTIAEVMEAVVMPAADVVWNAPGDDLKGPANDEGWLAARHGAVALAESANLLVVPGRAAHPPTKKLNEGELSAAAIEKLIADNRGAWVGYARGLDAAAVQVLAAIDARDGDKLLDAGGAINDACEGCHKRFWYPNQ